MSDFNAKKPASDHLPINPMTSDLGIPGHQNSAEESPETLAELKKLQDQSKYKKARFGLKMYPINK